MLRSHCATLTLSVLGFFLVSGREAPAASEASTSLWGPSSVVTPMGPEERDWETIENLGWFCPFGLKLLPTYISRCADFEYDVRLSRFLYFRSISGKKRTSKKQIHTKKLKTWWKHGLVASIWTETLPIYKSRWREFESDVRLLWILDFRPFSISKFDVDVDKTTRETSRSVECRRSQ